MDSSTFNPADYFKRSYPNPKVAMQHQKNPSEFDIKMLRVLPKMHIHYQAHKNRKCIVKISDDEGRDLIYKAQGLGGKVVKKDDKIKKEPKAPKPVATLCGATKMNGEICGCKVKNGALFCGRHTPK